MVTTQPQRVVESVSKLVYVWFFPLIPARYVVYFILAKGLLTYGMKNTSIPECYNVSKRNFVYDLSAKYYDDQIP